MSTISNVNARLVKLEMFQANKIINRKYTHYTLAMDKVVNYWISIHFYPSASKPVHIYIHERAVLVQRARAAR